MSQRIVVYCDLHAAQDEDVPGRPYDLALRAAEGPFTFATVDLCEACAKPLLDTFAELAEVGREFEGSALPTAGNKTGRPAMSRTCPICQQEFNRRDSLRSHAKRVHATTLGAAETKPRPAPTAADLLPCPHCERQLVKPQGLSAHIRSAHPAEYAAAREGE